MRNYLTSKFYCMNCGKEGIPILRSRAKMREKNHRKVLYCPHCKQEVNHVECRTLEDIENFVTAFNNGEFIEEATASLQHMKGLILNV